MTPKATELSGAYEKDVYLLNNTLFESMFGDRFWDCAGLFVGNVRKRDYFVCYDMLRVWGRISIGI